MCEVLYDAAARMICADQFGFQCRTLGKAQKRTPGHEVSLSNMFQYEHRFTVSTRTVNSLDSMRDALAGVMLVSGVNGVESLCGGLLRLRAMSSFTFPFSSYYRSK